MDRLDFMENNSRIVECKTHRCGGFSTGEHIIILFNYAERVFCHLGYIWFPKNTKERKKI